MSIILRSLCVISCLVSGLYCLLIFHNFKRSMETFWYGIFCFVLAIYSNSEYMINPNLLSVTTSENFVTGNLFLVFFSFVILFFNIYISVSVPRERKIYYVVLNYIIGAMIVASFIIPKPFYVPTFIIISLFQTLSAGFAVYFYLGLIKKVSKTYIYAVIAYLLLIICIGVKIALLLQKKDFVNPIAELIPFFMILHILLLSRQYSESMQRTKQLSQSLSETITKITHSDNALMCTQMKADFLYKSLDLITKKCDEDPFTAEDLTISLSKYLRHTLNFQQLKGVVPLSNEIELTKAYIDIEKERNKNITFEFNIPNPVPDFHIPPLSIQPLVENAIEHGVAGKEKGRIKITIIPYRNYYHIDVSDNGEGMSEEMASSLTERLYDSARIGVYNIHGRLNNLFGKGLVIQSAPGVGTSVSFVVPLNAEEIANEEVKE